MEKKRIIKILKSGNFSIYYHDNGCASIYEGKYNFDEIQDEEWDKLQEEKLIFESEPDGYYTLDVELLVEALDGELYSV